MKAVTGLAALCGTLTLHAAIAVLAIGMLSQPEATPPAPLPAAIEAHLAPQPLPPAVKPAPPPAAQAAPTSPPTPPASHRRAAPAAAPRPPAKAGAAPATATALPQPAAASEAAPAPAASPPAASAPQAANKPASPAPAPAPVRTEPSIPANYAANNRTPSYPLISRRYGEQGTVVLRVHIKADGSAGEVLLKTSSGYPLLDESAKTAVQDWRFHPATLNGKPIAEWYELPIPFKLSDSQHH